MDANRNCSSISLFTLDPLNVDHELFAVALSHFANLLTLVMSSNNLQADQLDKLEH